MRQVGYGFPFVDVSFIVEEANPGAISTWKEHAPRKPSRARARSEERSNPRAIPVASEPRAWARRFRPLSE